MISKVSGTMGGGMHGHVLNRAELATANDGEHNHLFELPDGQLVRSAFDGTHAHALEAEDVETTDFDGQHAHAVTLMSGERLMTDSGGGHRHPAGVTTTGVGGVHTHTLTVDGTEVVSLTAGEFWQRYAVEEFEGLRLRLSKGSDVDVEWTAPIVKADHDERLVTGIVLEPGEVDTQNDTISAEEIRQAAYRFMRDLNVLTGPDLMHESIPEGVHVVESWIARVDQEWTDPEGKTQRVKAGSWLVTMRVLNDDIWADILSGKLTGFSVTGFASERPVAGAVD